MYLYQAQLENGMPTFHVIVLTCISQVLLLLNWSKSVRRIHIPNILTSDFLFDFALYISVRMKHTLMENIDNAPLGIFSFDN